MAIYKIFPEKDATLYSQFPNMNTGLDPMMEATLTTTIAPNDPNPQVSRTLIKFPTNSITNIIDNLVSTSSIMQTNLRCFMAKTTGLELDTTVDVWALSGSWGMGTGRYLDSPLTTNGVSWTFTNYSGSNKWDIPFANPGVTFDYDYRYAPPGGGNWYQYQSNAQPLSSSQEYTYSSNKDLNVDVTPIINAWLTGSVNVPGIGNVPMSNEGFLIKQRTEWVSNINAQPEIKYFSIDTNTIYPPVLEVKWDDFTYNTGSTPIPILDKRPATVLIAQNPGTFYSESINRFRINSRPEYPARVWQTASLYTENYALPSGSSMWALKDLDTNEYLVDFDPVFTQLSADISGSYFDMYMSGLQPERYYQILIKTQIDGSTIIFNDEYYFKVING
tara:strand:+ start:2442 stop:3608 length:1167 start_codon:yes stop_codon:yes gene_type:complete